MNETNLDSLCRLCLRNSFFYMPIYVGQSVDNNPIYEVINYVYGLEVFVDDGLPEYICGDCLAKLKEFEIYKRNVHKAKSELLSLKRSVDNICIKEEEIDEMELKDEQITNEAEIKSPSRGGNDGLSDEDNGGRLEVYIKQENLQESSEDESLENLDQDEVSNIKVHSMRDSNQESTQSCTSLSNEERLSFECAMCSMQFLLKQQLKEHIVAHNENDKFACQTCEKRFEKYSYLRKHKLVHKEEKSFGCADCGKRFRLKQQLKEHVRIHTGEQPFVCEHCGRRFNQKSNLNTHLLVHKDKKRFQCEECGKAFVRLVQLKSHMNTHAGQKGFECPLCKNKFNHLSNLKRHLLIHSRRKEIITSL